MNNWRKGLPVSGLEVAKTVHDAGVAGTYREIF